MPYCTVDDLKLLGYKVTDDNKADMEKMCEVATSMVDSYCRQTFSPVTDDVEEHEVRVKNGVVNIFPRNLVISKIHSAEFIQFGRVPIPYKIEELLYFRHSAVIMGVTNAPDGEYLVNLKYDHGYDEIPQELARATAFAIVPTLDDYFSADGTGMTGIKMLQQGKVKYERDNSAKNSLNSIPQNAIAILNGGNGGVGYVRVRGDYL